MRTNILRAVSLLPLVGLLLGGCSEGQSGLTGGAQPTAAKQMVFMLPTGGDYSPPSPTNNHFELALMNLDGSGLQQLTSDGKFKFLPHFSPDGGKILYTKFAVGGYNDPTSKVDIFVFDLASAQEKRLTFTGLGIQAVWSPDGQRIAYGSYQNDSLSVMNADASDATVIARPSRAPDDVQWGDYAWSSDDWILFTVAQNISNCFKTRLDKLRPDGTERTQVTDGGPNCTPAGGEQSGDADPGWSPDAKTIYSSRGFPPHPAGATVGTERKLYSFSSDAWVPGKTEMDLSLPAEPSCVEGLPKASPDGTRVLLFRSCFDAAAMTAGIYVTDTAGAYRTFVTHGFGADWNPVYKP